MAVSNLLSGRDKNGKRPADNELEETKEGGTVDVDQEIDDALHNGQGKDESGPCTVESSVDGVGELLIGCESHVLGEAGGGGSSSFCGFAAGEKALLGTCDGALGRITRRLESEDNEEEGKNGICDPSQGEKMGQLEIWPEGG